MWKCQLVRMHMLLLVLKVLLLIIVIVIFMVAAGSGGRVAANVGGKCRLNNIAAYAFLGYPLMVRPSCEPASCCLEAIPS